MQSDKPNFSLTITDKEREVCTSSFRLEKNFGWVARSQWLNVSDIQNLRLTVKDAQGHSLTIKLSNDLSAQASTDTITMTVQGSQGFNRRNLAFTVFVRAKASEAA